MPSAAKELRALPPPKGDFRADAEFFISVFLSFLRLFAAIGVAIHLPTTSQPELALTIFLCIRLGYLMGTQSSFLAATTRRWVGAPVPPLLPRLGLVSGRLRTGRRKPIGPPTEAAINSVLVVLQDTVEVSKSRNDRLAARAARSGLPPRRPLAHRAGQPRGGATVQPERSARERLHDAHF